MAKNGGWPKEPDPPRRSGTNDKSNHLGVSEPESNSAALCAARCDDGFPEHGNFKKMLMSHDSPEALLATINGPGSTRFDQWQVQLLALVLLKARVGLHCEVAADELRRAHFRPVVDVGRDLRAELAAIGPDSPVAVLPEGPLTIPYLAA